MPPRKADAPVKHLTIQEFADRMGVSVQTVYGWNTRGTGPNYMRNGLLVRYRLADVEEWERSLLARPA